MHSILHGDCLAMLPTLPANSIDAIVTDPPAGISFMGREWDKDKGGRDQWIAWMQQVAAECLRCIKPGGHALVWALPRTSHWTATAWENAGWEVRDVVHHLFGSGFPKSLAVDKAIDKHFGVEFSAKPASGVGFMGPDRPGGYNRTVNQLTREGESTPEAQQFAGFGTALKPACENWILLRRPLIGTVAQNVLEHGTGALNIDASRVGKEQLVNRGMSSLGVMHDDNWQPNQDIVHTVTGRWPPNLLLDGSEEVVECFPHTHHAGNTKPVAAKAGTSMFGIGEHEHNPAYYPGEADHSTARFFPSLGFTDDERRILYCPKASRKDRNGSRHPTIKPIRLIEWLCKLICPPNGTILDPFAGSGTTGQAAISLGFDVIMIEREDEYVADILKRVSWPPLPADAP